MEKILNYINLVKKFNKDESREIVISLQNTVSSDEDKNSIYFLPVRVFQEYIICGVTNANNDEAIFFLENAQDYAKYIFLDVEKKYPWIECQDSKKLYMGNIEVLLKDIIHYEKIIYIWPNSLTVEACLRAIIENGKILSLSKVAVIGIGNIGFKLSLRLIESGCKTSLVSKDYDQTLYMANAINKIKPKSTIVSPIPFREIASCVNGQDYLVFCTDGKFKIDSFTALNISPNTKIFSLSNLKLEDDVENILNEKNISLEIIDIAPFYFAELFKQKICMETEKPLRIAYKNTFLVSGGYRAKTGDIIVNNAINPEIVLGKIKTDGQFDREISLWEDWEKHNLK